MINLSRVDIEEGDMPSGNSYGRIKSIPILDEWYVSYNIEGQTVFVAIGHYERTEEWQARCFVDGS